MKKIMVMLPALNEEKTIADVIGRIPKEITVNGQKEPEVCGITVMVIDDGSTDRTVEMSKAAGALVVSHGINKGVGAAFATGVRETLKRDFDYMVNMDADGQMDPNDIGTIIEPLIKEETDFVTASRFKNLDKIPKMTKIKIWGNGVVAFIISKIVDYRFYDVSCGFRAYSRDTLMKLNLYGKFTYTQETFINLASRGDVRMLEIPLAIRGIREHGKSRVASNIPKYAMRSLNIILRTYRDYKPFAFFGSISAIMFAIAVIFEIIFFAHFIQTGFFKGYLACGLVGAFLAIVSFIMIIVAMLADMIGKVVRNQENQLYISKKQLYSNDL